ncbi:site-specific integrase [Poseidonocella sp. HB161398]|uniref:tyrosine-type recombinase/integrase n=1 Tax=Poseidonocella sp. HB161398 TaxID=2320855 RepID=UPI001107C9EC|nr:site-specific integrase [Poseidonocella sp. HB161398]
MRMEEARKASGPWTVKQNPKGQWGFEFRAKGERVRSYKAAWSQRDAMIEAKAAYEAAMGKTARPATTVPTYREVLERYRTEKEEEALLQNKPITRYIEPMEEMLDYFGDWLVSDIWSEEVRQYAREFYKGRNVTGQTMNKRVMDPMSTLLNFASMRFKGVMAPRLEKFETGRRKRKDFATPGWTRAFVAAAKASEASTPAYFGYGMAQQVCLMTGMRMCSYRSLRWSDVDWDKHEVVVSRVKNGDENVRFKLPEGLMDELAEWEALQRSLCRGEVEGVGSASVRRFVRTGERLMPERLGEPQVATVCSKWKRIAALAKIKPLTPHDSGRRTFANALHGAGWHADEIAPQGGWEDSAIVTKHYVRAVDRAADAHSILKAWM